MAIGKKRFEEKRIAAHQPFGPAPAGIYGPSNDFVNNLKHQPAGTDNSSCGQSGSRSCSYIADPIARKAAADARVLAVNIESAALMNDTLLTCKHVE